MRAWKQLRRTQVQQTARILLALQRFPAFKGVLTALGRVPMLEEALVGYRRAFRTRASAESRVRREGSIGHADPRAIALHRSFEETPRPSDFPVMEHLTDLLPRVRRVVDVGGSVGNLFYLYSRHVAFPDEIEWVVLELPESVKHGRTLAADRGEARLRFEHSMERCGAADLALFSGSLHYFEEPPPALLAGLGPLPQFVLVNRSPVANAPSLYAVQDAGEWLTAARVLDREALLGSMEDAGYRMLDEWPCYELNVRFPLHPQHSAEHYSGFLFERETSQPRAD